MSALKFFFIFIIIIAIFEDGFCQGQLFTKEEADSRFGAVEKSITVESDLIFRLIERTGSVLMFNIIDGDLVVLDDSRKVLHSGVLNSVPDDIKFYFYNISVIRELIDRGKDVSTKVEKRTEVITLTNGNTTMEYGSICPPICPGN